MPRYKSQLGHPCLSSNQAKPNHLSSISAIKEKDRRKRSLKKMVNLVNSCALVLAISSLMMIFMMSGPLSAVDASGDHHLNLGWLPTGSSLVGDEEEGEFELDSETNRRILATSNYISYGALQRNTVPCSRRGASYYNCQNGGQANPYNRGCSTITRCRS